VLDTVQRVHGSEAAVAEHPEDVADYGHLKATYRIITDDRSQAHRASVRDLSLAGVVLLTDRPIERGTILLVGFHDSPVPMLARVQHVTVRSQGQWSVCCSFALRLSEALLETLLEANTAFLAPDAQ
jgi:hypothetical protein